MILVAPGAPRRDAAWHDAATTSALALLRALRDRTQCQDWELTHRGRAVLPSGAPLATQLRLPADRRHLTLHAEPLPRAGTEAGAAGATKKRRDLALEQMAPRGTAPEAARARRHLDRARAREGARP